MPVLHVQHGRHRIHHRFQQPAGGFLPALGRELFRYVREGADIAAAGHGLPPHVEFPTACRNIARCASGTWLKGRLPLLEPFALCLLAQIELGEVVVDQVLDRHAFAKHVPRDIHNLGHAVVPSDQPQLAIDQVDAVGHVVEGGAQDLRTLGQLGLVFDQLLIPFLQVAHQVAERQPRRLEGLAQDAELVGAAPHLVTQQGKDDQHAQRELHEAGHQDLPPLLADARFKAGGAHFDFDVADALARAHHRQSPGQKLAVPALRGVEAQEVREHGRGHLDRRDPLVAQNRFGQRLGRVRPNLPDRRLHADREDFGQTVVVLDQVAEQSLRSPGRRQLPASGTCRR
jgi:hypothetical protein